MDLFKKLILKKRNQKKNIQNVIKCIAQTSCRTV